MIPVRGKGKRRSEDTTDGARCTSSPEQRVSPPPSPSKPSLLSHDYSLRQRIKPLASFTIHNDNCPLTKAPRQVYTERHPTLIKSNMASATGHKGRKRKNIDPAEQSLSINIPRKRTRREKELPMQPLPRQWIRRAISYGAIWKTTWGSHIDYLIVDEEYEYKDALEELHLASFHNSLNVVNCNYTVECIEWDFKLDPTFPAYQLEGDPKKLPKELRNKVADSYVLSSQDLSEDLYQSLSTPTSIKKTSHNSQSSEVSLYITPSPMPVKVTPRSGRPNATPVSNVFDFNAALTKARKISSFSNQASVESDYGFSTDEEKGAFADQAVDKKQSKKARGSALDVSKFACMQPGSSSSSSNPNIRTIEVLQEMCNYYGVTNNTWRQLAYRRAVSALSREKTYVGTAKDARKINGIGESLAIKIEEIATTSHLQLHDKIQSDPANQALDLFTKIYGVGPAQAHRWIGQGYHEISDIPLCILTPSQKIGIDHFTDFNTRVPRSEVAEHRAIVTRALHKIDSELRTYIMGSYRRGAKTCGDIDLLITGPNANVSSLRTILLEDLLPALTEQGFIVAALASPGVDKGSIWHGASRLPGETIWRRLDLLLVPEAELGAAIIYFTGDELFNRSLRLSARKKGLRLNQRGLWARIKEITEKNDTQGRLIEGKNELKIFEELGVPWREAEPRNMAII
ncbi:MAG: hypothetical protein M1814_003116 [Vezdaea aestivalis]|nr:MAG: hypothetical protein M1814_003116 [Vezdaea aestivalis]